MDHCLILSLDPAIRTGWCVGPVGGKPQLGTVNLGGRQYDEHPDIFARAVRWIDLQLSDKAVMGMPDVLAIEEPVAPWKVMGETQYAATKIALGLQAIYMGRARDRGVRIITAPIQSWRKYALGSGRMKGTEAKAACVRLVLRLGWQADESEFDHNAAEAAGIFLYAGSRVSPAHVTRHEPLFLQG